MKDVQIRHKNWANYLNIVCETVLRMRVFCNLQHKTQVTETWATPSCCTPPPWSQGLLVPASGPPASALAPWRTLQVTIPGNQSWKTRRTVSYPGDFNTKMPGWSPAQPPTPPLTPTWAREHPKQYRSKVGQSKTGRPHQVQKLRTCPKNLEEVRKGERELITRAQAARS